MGRPENLDDVGPGHLVLSKRWIDLVDQNRTSFVRPQLRFFATCLGPIELAKQNVTLFAQDFDVLLVANVDFGRDDRKRRKFRVALDYVGIYGNRVRLNRTVVRV